MQNQYSPHIISGSPELLLPGQYMMEGFRILIGEPSEGMFRKPELQFFNIKPQFNVVQKIDGKLLLCYLSAKLSNSHKLYADIKSFVVDLNYFLL